MQLHSRAPTASRGAFRDHYRTRVVCTAQATYEAPSSATAANELVALDRLSTLVPDALLLESAVPLKAATVSNLVIKGVMSSQQLGARPFQNAVTSSLTYERCLKHSGAQRLACQLDKATANVGAMLAAQVEGRVSTEVDPRLANDAGAMVSKVEFLVSLYQEMGVPPSKLIFRLPATWEGIEAAAALEAQGIATQVFMVYSFVQGVAAAQAGVSIVQPNVGRTRDWYNRNPGVIRDPKGPREDSGFASSVDPGLSLVRKLYNYAHRFHPGTQVMASGLRSKEDALALAGCDFLVVSAKVMDALAATPTMQGYNDGLSASAGSGEDGIARVLGPEAARSAQVEEMPRVTAEAFREGLGVAGQELLDAGLKGLVQDVQDVLPYLQTMTVGTE